MSDILTFVCPNCLTIWKAPTEVAGRDWICKRCNGQIAIPPPTTSVEDKLDRLAQTSTEIADNVGIAVRSIQENGKVLGNQTKYLKEQAREVQSTLGNIKIAFHEQEESLKVCQRGIDAARQQLAEQTEHADVHADKLSKQIANLEHVVASNSQALMSRLESVAIQSKEPSQPNEGKPTPPTTTPEQLIQVGEKLGYNFIIDVLKSLFMDLGRCVGGSPRFVFPNLYEVVKAARYAFLSAFHRLVNVHVPAAIDEWQQNVSEGVSKAPFEIGVFFVVLMCCYFTDNSEETTINRTEQRAGHAHKRKSKARS